MPRTIPRQPARYPQKPMKINIISMSRGHHNGLFPKTGAGSCGRMPRTKPCADCPPKSRNLLKINIISMSRRHHAGLSAKIEAGFSGRMPRTICSQACPRSSKAAENQYLYPDVTLGCPSCWCERGRDCRTAAFSGRLAATQS